MIIPPNTPDLVQAIKPSQDVEELEEIRAGGYAFTDEGYEKAAALVRRMATYNPYGRISADEALDDDFFRLQVSMPGTG